MSKNPGQEEKGNIKHNNTSHYDDSDRVPSVRKLRHIRGLWTGDSLASTASSQSLTLALALSSCVSALVEREATVARCALYKAARPAV